MSITNTPIHTSECFSNGYKVDRVTVRQSIPDVGLVYVFSIQITNKLGQVVESLITIDPVRGQDTINYWSNK